MIMNVSSEIAWHKEQAMRMKDNSLCWAWHVGELAKFKYGWDRKVDLAYLAGAMMCDALGGRVSIEDARRQMVELKGAATPDESKRIDNYLYELDHPPFFKQKAA